MTLSAEQLAVELYDSCVPDWEGELDFYRELAHGVGDRRQSVLEVACGTPAFFILAFWQLLDGHFSPVVASRAVTFLRYRRCLWA